MGFLGGGSSAPVVQAPVDTAAQEQAKKDKVSKQTQKQLKQDYGASLIQGVTKYAQSVSSGSDTTLSSGSLLGLS